MKTILLVFAITFSLACNKFKLEVVDENDPFKNIEWLRTTRTNLKKDCSSCPVIVKNVWMKIDTLYEIAYLCRKIDIPNIVFDKKGVVLFTSSDSKYDQYRLGIYMSMNENQPDTLWRCN